MNKNKKVKNKDVMNEIEIIEQDMADILLGIISGSPGFSEDGLKDLAKAHGMGKSDFEMAFARLEEDKRIFRDVEDGIYPEEN